MGVLDFIFDPGKKASERAGRATAQAVANLKERFDKQRGIVDEEFNKTFDQLTAAQNPFLAGIADLEGEFRQSPQRLIGPSSIAANLQARRAGGGRGQAFSTGAAGVGAQAGVGIGANLGILQQQALQNISALRQFSANLALPQQAGLISQRFGLQGALSQADLSIQGQLQGAGAANIAQANISAIGQGLPGAFGTQFGTLLGGAAFTSGGGGGGGGGGQALGAII